MGRIRAAHLVNGGSHGCAALSNTLVQQVLFYDQVNGRGSANCA
jgi:hypothetical protein